MVDHCRDCKKYDKNTLLSNEQDLGNGQKYMFMSKTKACGNCKKKKDVIFLVYASDKACKELKRRGVL